MDLSEQSLRVKLTQPDIDKARRKDSWKCVVAQTVKRHVPEAKRVSVDIQAIKVFTDEAIWTYLTPRVVQDYIVAFDAGRDEQIVPMSFTLKDPFRSQRRAHTPKGSKAERERRAAVETALGEGLTKEQADDRGRIAYEAAKREAGPGPVRERRTGDQRIPTSRARAYGVRALEVNRRLAELEAAEVK
jgi:hypothetical protein